MSDITHFSIDFLSKSPILGWSALIILLALSFYHYRRTNPPLPAKIKYPLLGLRILALLALFLTLLEPVISYRLGGERKQRLTIALDVSGSMSQSNQAENGASRLATVDSVFGAGDNLLANLSDNYDISWRYFADSLMATREAPNQTSSSQTNSSQSSVAGTAIGEALADLAKSDIDEPADLWMLISDGINNSGRDPLQVSQESKTPLYTIGVGEQTPDFDIEIADVEFNPIAYVGAETPIKVSLRWRGVGETAREALIELRETSEQGAGASASAPKSTQRIKLGQGALSSEIELKFTPTNPGAAFLSATVTTTIKERKTENNTRIFAIKVLKNRLKVALVSEQLSWDHKFLKDALQRNQRVEVTEFTEKNPGVYIGEKFPTSQGAVNKFDVIVLLNPSSIRRDNRYSLLQNYLSAHGGGLFVLAGDRMLRKGQGASEADGTVSLNSIFPLSPAKGYSGQLKRATAITLRGENILHPALRISEGNEDVREIWRSFPPFVTVSPLTELNSDSGEVLVLAESDYQIQTNGLTRVIDTSVAADPDNIKPVALLVAQKRGAGKVLALNGSPIWRMAFQSVQTEQTTRHFNEFINGAVNWLSVIEDLSPVRIEPERSIYSRGEISVFSGSAFDQSYRALDLYSGDVFLYSADQADTLVATMQNIGEGTYRAEFSGLTPGAYRFEGRSFVDGELIKVDTGRIQVTQYSLEQRKTTPDFSSLQTLAQSSGGKYTHISNVNDLSQTLIGAKLNIAEEVEIPLRGDWRFLALFIVALSIEWFIRKRLQLL